MPEIDRYRLDEAERQLAAGNQRRAFSAFERVFYNPGLEPGGLPAILERGRAMRPKVTGRYEAKWDALLAKAAAAVAPPATHPAAEPRVAAQSPAQEFLTEPATSVPQLSTSAPRAASPRATNVVPGNPYWWADAIAALCVIVAALSVVGGFVLAGSHSHHVAATSGFPSTPAHDERDYNYAGAGGIVAIGWIALAAIIVLLRQIAQALRNGE